MLLKFNYSKVPKNILSGGIGKDEPDQSKKAAIINRPKKPPASKTKPITNMVDSNQPKIDKIDKKAKEQDQKLPKKNPVLFIPPKIKREDEDFNLPLDMISFLKDGKESIYLVARSGNIYTDSPNNELVGWTFPNAYRKAFTSDPDKMQLDIYWVEK